MHKGPCENITVLVVANAHEADVTVGSEVSGPWAAEDRNLNSFRRGTCLRRERVVPRINVAWDSVPDPQSEPLETALKLFGATDERAPLNACQFVDVII